MIKHSIDKQICNLDNEIQSKKENIENSTLRLKTSSEVIKNYEQHVFEFDKKSANQKKKVEKEIRKLKEQNKFLDDDLNKMKNLENSKKELAILENELEDMNMYFQIQTDKIKNILYEDKFIDYVLNEEQEEVYSLTELGSIASNIAEVHPIIMTRLLQHWDYFTKFTPEQIVGVLSCFTDIKLPSDERSLLPNSDNNFVNDKLFELSGLFEGYDQLEQEKQINSGIRYDDALQYDLIDLSMRWCELDNEIDCRKFIEIEVKKWNISIGDFTKAMLKIVTIAKELIGVFETETLLLNYVDTLQKLTLIESKILKYVMTYQSLYV